MTYTSYQKKKLKALGEVDELVTRALAKLNQFAGGGYVGDLRELKELVKIKIKLEQVQKRIAVGYTWENQIYERSSTRTYTEK
jgi:hypothetical protein